MSILLRVREIVGRPVVTLGGEAVAQVRDVAFVADHGDVAGFTLAKRTTFGGPMKEVLAWSAVVSLGPDAVMVNDEQALSSGPLAPPSSSDGDVLGDRVVTDGGVELGSVVDVVVEVTDGRAGVVGYEIEPAAGFEPVHGRRGRQLFIPWDDALAASGEAVIVPAAAVDYIAEDFAGFGAAIDGFRSRLRNGGR